MVDSDCWPLNATDMPMIGPLNAITLQSSKTRVRSGAEKIFAKPYATAVRRRCTLPAPTPGRTFSAHVRVRLVRGTPKPCIDAINAINAPECARYVFLFSYCAC
ncbi:hypothetical protein [Caballeronia glathei]|uniref:hypothetical protein n=1 Tax=Caballeronia glathei TaxID=60547 RepID=UPI00101A2740|nr:hypothetical protein [Caballeronia glathei]